MKISESIDVLKKQLLLERTPKGRPITKSALLVVETTIEDQKNYHIDAIKCLNCGIILSSLLVPQGCVNCRSKDLLLKI